MENYIYHFDRITVIFKYTIAEMEEIIRNYDEELDSKCPEWSFKEVSEYAEFHGYFSKLDVISPSAYFLEKLSCLSLSGYQYSISYLEIAVDVLCDTRAESIELTEFFQKHAIRSHATGYAIYNGEDKPAKPGVYSSTTLYIGDRNSKFKIAAYARESKPAKLIGQHGKPCLHIEWRIRSAAIVKQKTGIKLFKDLDNFSVENWIRAQGRSLSFQEIAFENLGRFLQEMTRLAVKPRPGLEQPLKAGRIFCRARRISAAGELLGFCQEIVRKAKSKVGRREEGVEKFTKLTAYHRKSFLKPVPEEVIPYAILKAFSEK